MRSPSARSTKSCNSSYALLPLEEDLSFEPFELKRVEVVPPRRDGKAIREGFRIILTIFELGEFTVPAFTVYFKDGEGRIGKVLTDELRIRVESIGRTEHDSDDIRPIKVPYRLTGLWIQGRAFTWVLIGLLLVLLSFGVFWFLKKRRHDDSESRLPPYERALLRLERLGKKGHLDAGREKLYFTELYGILERYLIEQFQLGSEDLTTEEFLEAVRQSVLDREVQSKIRDVAGLASLVKFAKWVPPRVESEDALRKARGVVEQTRPMEKEKADTERKKKAVTV